METQFASWLLDQGPALVVLVVGFGLLYRQNVTQQQHLQRLLDECWRRVLQGDKDVRG